ncbi:Phosphatidylglycerophosphatase A [Desulfonema magnum]|uniref:Phosphatidylglycerophosphatase A n=2 Tax=Desulfonema magnum TaxID=45655 RepID=A0A975BUG7_9BACT|nr:Phosphatidylglycerophosphatase A [Desulfonema magnum]
MKIKNFVYIAIGSALGLGLSPFFPGTFGASAGVLFHVLIVFFLPVKIQWAALVFVFILVCSANHVLTPWAEDYWGCKDPKYFVLDEVAGYLLIPILFRYGQLWKVVLWGFLLFRVFDIFKLIPPARQIDQNMHGAWGILLDDLVSAGYAVLVMYLIYWLGPSWLISDS